MFSTWAEAWSDRALPILWQSALVFGVVWLAVKLMRRQRPALRRALWALVLVRLVLPADFALPIGIGNLAKPIIPRQEATAAASPAVAADHEVVRAAPMPVPSALPSVNTQPGLAPAAAAAPSATPGPAGGRFSLDLAVFAIWSAGILALAAFLLRRYRALRRCAVKARPVTAGPLHELFLRCCERIPPGRVKPMLCTSREVASPMLVGIRRPRVILPERILQVCSPEELEALVLHELAHLRQWDLPINCAQVALQVLHWYNPLVWFANRELRRERELCCDDRVLLATGLRRREYAAGLVKVLELTPPGLAWSMGALGVVESKATLQRRINRIMDTRLRPAPRLTLLSAVGLLLFGAIVLACDPCESPNGGPPAEPTAAEDADSGPGDETGQRAGGPAPLPFGKPLAPSEGPPRDVEKSSAELERVRAELEAEEQELREKRAARSEALAAKQRELEEATARLDSARAELSAKRETLRERADDLTRIRSGALAERQRVLAESTAELDRARSELLAAYWQLREAAGEVRRLRREMLAEHRREVQEALREVARARSEVLKQHNRELHQQWEEYLRSLREWAPDLEHDWSLEVPWLLERDWSLDVPVVPDCDWLLELPEMPRYGWSLRAPEMPEHGWLPKHPLPLDEDWFGTPDLGAHVDEWRDHFEMFRECVPDDVVVDGLPLPNGDTFGPHARYRDLMEWYSKKSPPDAPLPMEELRKRVEEGGDGGD
jgi:beta-lactamase regulating signal transducer with metallopeptidase domain